MPGNNENSKTLALFDFDGTISNKDSLFDFLKYSVGFTSYYKKIFLLLPVFIRYFFKLISNSEAKESVISYFFKNWSIEKFKVISDSYSDLQIDRIIKKSAIDKINWHKSNKHRIVIVSASIECYLSKWCEKHQIEIIGTKLEVNNNKLSGKLLTQNCNGEEKVRRIKEKINLNEYNQIYAYGNSKGDFPMLELADQKYYRIFS